MKAIILLLAVASAFSFNLRQTKQSYDSYVMAVQWPNGYCKAKSCGGREKVVPKNSMTIHGLWPSLKSGAQLNQCTNGVKVVDDGSSLFSNMKTYWPSFSKLNKDFWEHEYNKHGHCMSEYKGWGSYKQYFNYVIDLHLRTYKSLISRAFSSGEPTVSYDELVKKVRNIIPGAIINMKCTSGYISEFYFYLDLNMNPSPGSKFSNSCKSGTLVVK